MKMSPIVLQILFVVAGTCTGPGCTIELRQSPNGKNIPSGAIQAPASIPIDYFYTCQGECPGPRPLLKITQTLPTSSLTGLVASRVKSRAHQYLHRPEKDEFFNGHLGIEPVLYNPSDPERPFTQLDKLNFAAVVYGGRKAPDGPLVEYIPERDVHITLWRETFPSLSEAMELIDPETQLATKSFHWRIRGPAVYIPISGTHRLDIVACLDDGKEQCQQGTEQRAQVQYQVGCRYAERWRKNPQDTNEQIFAETTRVYEQAIHRNLEACTDIVRMREHGKPPGEVTFWEDRTSKHEVCCARNSGSGYGCTTNYVVFDAMVCVGGVDKAPEFYRRYKQAKLRYEQADPALPPRWEGAIEIADDAQRARALEKIESLYLMKAYFLALNNTTTLSYDSGAARRADPTQQGGGGGDAAGWKWMAEFTEKWAKAKGAEHFGIRP